MEAVIKGRPKDQSQPTKAATQDTTPLCGKAVQVSFGLAKINDRKHLLKENYRAYDRQ